MATGSAKSGEELAAVYSNTVYEVDLSDGSTIEFGVNAVCPALDDLLASAKANEAVFITAYNPASVAVGDAENTAAQENLKSDLLQQGSRFLPGQGVDPTGVWPPEPSFFVFAITRARGGELAEKYGQYAFLYIAVRKPPELVMLT
jgi:hypothetical protein